MYQQQNAYGIVKRKALRKLPPQQMPRRPQGPPPRLPFQGREAQDELSKNVKELAKGADLVKNLTGVRDALKRSADEGGVDRGGSKGTGNFAKVLTALREVQDIEGKGKDKDRSKETRKALGKLVDEAEKWLKEDRKETAKDSTRANEVVATRKRQAAEAIVLHGKAAETMLAMQGATDWNTYDEALRQAETAVRNCQAASLTAKNAPQRRTGGDSDTYKIIDSGKVVFFFKPQTGEAVAEGWESVKGGGAPREVLVSEFGDQMKKLGFDFNVPKITEASLTSGDFTQGSQSQDTSQTGVVIDAVDGQDGESVLKALKKLPPDRVKAFKKSIPTEDVHNVLVLDFLTLNMDRHQGNVIFDTDMDDNGNFTPPTKITPIDAGNMLPPEDVFDGVKVGGFASQAASLGMDAPIRDDEAVPNEGMHILMQLPQAKQPFDQVMIDKIMNLDPKAVVKGMKDANAKRQGNMAGKIGEDTFQMVEASTHFLKLVVGQTPPPIANVIGKLYAIDEGFKAFKDARRQLVANLTQGQDLDETQLIALVAQGTAIAQQMAQDEMRLIQDTKDYAALGGDDELTKYGWDSYALTRDLTLPQKIDLLQRKTNNPKAETERDKQILDNKITRNLLPNDYDTMTLETQLRTVKKIAEEQKAYANVQQRGGDNEIQRILAAVRQAGATPSVDRPESQMTWQDKMLLLDRWDEFEKLGGYAAYNDAIRRGMRSKPTALGDQSRVLKSFQEEESLVQAAEAAGGERTFNALKAAVARFGFKNKSLEKSYDDLLPKQKKDLTEGYSAIKNLPAFRNYDQLVQQGELKATTDVEVFLRNVKYYKAKG